MKLVPIIAAVVVLGAALTAQQTQSIDYVITPRVFALAGAGSDEAAIIGSGVQLRTSAGEPASINLVAKGADGTKLVVVPTDLGGGRIALRVEFSLIQAGQTSTANFDVLSGPRSQPATVAARDANGGFIRDQFGRPIYATFDVTTRPSR